MRNPAWRRGSERKTIKVGVLCLLAIAGVSFGSAGKVLPDELTVNVGEVANVGTNVTLVLTKRSMRADNCRVVLSTDDGFKNIDIPVTTYRGHVQGDPLMYVNGNIEPGGLLNANFTENRMIIARIRNLKIDVPEGKGTPRMTTGIKVVPLSSVRKRQVPSPGGYLVPEVPMRRTRWLVQVHASYVAHAGIEKAVSEVEQRMNDGDFVFARDTGSAWEIDTLLVFDPKATKHAGLNALFADDPARLNNCKRAGFTGVPGRNQGKWHLNVSGVHHEAGILLHEAAHVYGHPYHQLDVNDGLCGGGAYWAYNNVALLLEAQKGAQQHPALNETNFPAVIYGSPLPPHAMYDFANTRKDTPVTIDVLENDYSGSGNYPLSLQAVQSGSDKGGTVTISEDDKAIYTPAPGFLGADTFTYTVVDSAGVGNRSGQVKVSVGDEGVMIHYDFEQVEVERLEDRRETDPTDATLWFYDAYDRRPADEKRLHHFRNLGPYNTGNGAAEWLRRDVLKSLRGRGVQEPNPAGYENGRGTAHWIRHYPVDGVRGKGMWNPGGHGWAQVKLGDGGDPGRASLSASVWVLYPPGAGGNTILCKGRAPFHFVNGWAITGGAIGGTFEFSGNVSRLLPSEAFSLRSAEKIEADTWYHLVMVMDREQKQLRAWVNNKEIKNPDANVTIPDGVIEHYGPLHVFNWYTGKWWGATRAVVDEVKIFTSVLTPQQVAELYAEGKGAKAPELPDLSKP